MIASSRGLGRIPGGTTYAGIGAGEIDWESFLEGSGAVDYGPAAIDENGGGAPGGSGVLSGWGEVSGTGTMGDGSMVGNMVDTLWTQGARALGDFLAGGELPYMPGHLSDYGIQGDPPRYTTGAGGELLNAAGQPVGGALGGLGGLLGGVNQNTWLMIGGAALLVVALVIRRK